MLILGLSGTGRITGASLAPESKKTRYGLLGTIIATQLADSIETMSLAADAFDPARRSGNAPFHALSPSEFGDSAVVVRVARQLGRRGYYVAGHDDLASAMRWQESIAESLRLTVASLPSSQVEHEVLAHVRDVLAGLKLAQDEVFYSPLPMSSMVVFLESDNPLSDAAVLSRVHESIVREALDLNFPVPPSVADLYSGGSPHAGY